MTIPLAHQIAEVRREIALRRNVYPGLITRGKMRHGEAAEHLERMHATLATLEWLAANERRVRQICWPQELTTEELKHGHGTRGV